MKYAWNERDQVTQKARVRANKVGRKKVKQRQRQRQRGRETERQRLRQRDRD